jgi:hypothetical protein
MKVYISNYRYHWLSPYKILNAVFFWKKDYYPYDKDPPKWLNAFCVGLKAALNKIHPAISYVKIDPYDTWSMDTTLGLIVLPVLKQLKATQHGAPFTNDEDVPDALKSMNAPRVEHDYDTDEFFEARWDYILDQMIWSFEQMRAECDFGYKNLLDDEDISDYHVRQTKIKNGFRLFGKYYQNLWD